jgi:hypothetical protein
MRRTTVKISDELDARLRHEASRRGITFSALTREALETHLGLRPRRRILLGGATFDSGESNLGDRIDEILATEMVEKLEREMRGDTGSGS